MNTMTIEAQRPAQGPQVWYGQEMRTRENEWSYTWTNAEVAEIEAAASRIAAEGRDLISTGKEDFPLPSIAPRLERIRTFLLNGPGFFLFRGLPTSRWDIRTSAAAFWGLGMHLGEPCSQNGKGHVLGHVTNLGVDYQDPEARGYQTNARLAYHTDSCDIVGLMCLQTSRTGGESRIVSSVSLYNEMMTRRPDLAEALFNAYPTDRRGEIPEGHGPWFDVPVFNWHDGLLTTIYVGQYIRSAQANFPQARRLTPSELEALSMLDDLTNDPALNLQIQFRPGDMQFIHNHQILHARTDFEDWPEPERKRHLLRLWLSPRSGRALPDYFAPRYGSVVPGERGGIIVKGTELTFALAAV